MIAHLIAILGIAETVGGLFAFFVLAWVAYLELAKLRRRIRAGRPPCAAASASASDEPATAPGDAALASNRGPGVIIPWTWEIACEPPVDPEPPAHVERGLSTAALNPVTDDELAAAEADAGPPALDVF